MEATNYKLGKGEVLIYSTGADYGKDTIIFLNGTYQVKEEIKQSILNPKNSKNTFSSRYYVIVPDYDVISQIITPYGADLSQDLHYEAALNLQGTEDQKISFIEKLLQLSKGYQGYLGYDDNMTDKKDMEAMYGGLLFIGIFFGSIFLMCLLIIMYYKQITEGFEDQKNFDIMQKVGMSDIEVKRTIKKQILQVFFIPLAGAILHTTMGMFMVVNLMSVLQFYQTSLIITCAVGICVAFAIVYGICYNSTAKTYYKIVKRMS
jgi:putative ABC transport system permease protein